MTSKVKYTADCISQSIDSLVRLYEGNQANSIRELQLLVAGDQLADSWKKYVNECLTDKQIEDILSEHLLGEFTISKTTSNGYVIELSVSHLINHDDKGDIYELH